MDTRRIELKFRDCVVSQFELLSDDEDLASKGFLLKSRTREVEAGAYLEWFRTAWLDNGWCPESGLWIDPTLLISWPGCVRPIRRFVVAGRSCFVQVLASSFVWEEWLWMSGSRDELPLSNPAVAGGSFEDLSSAGA
jgi:hypothetical protein